MRIISMVKKQMVMLGNIFVSKTGKSEPRKGHGAVMIHKIIKALSSTRLDIKAYTLTDMVAAVSKVSQKLQLPFTVLSIGLPTVLPILGMLAPIGMMSCIPLCTNGTTMGILSASRTNLPSKNMQ